MKHAELPWIAFEDGQIQSINSKVVIWSSGLAKRSKNANAAFIVKACNNHERLLDALRELVYAANNPHSTWEAVREEVDKSIKVLDVIKAAQE